VVKATTQKARLGNPTPRVAEVTCGMLNSIGLANPGLDKVLSDELPWLKSYSLPVIVNVAGETVEEYCSVVDRISRSKLAHAIELNVSCPNVAQGGLSFGADSKVLSELLKRVRGVCSLPLFVKLSPNVTDIVEIGLAAQEAGADAISLINTLIGMKIDINTGRPVLARKVGGLVWTCNKASSNKNGLPASRCLKATYHRYRWYLHSRGRNRVYYGRSKCSSNRNS